MIIDQYRGLFSFISIVTFVMIVFISLISLIPYTLNKRKYSSFSLYFPFLTLILWLIYEMVNRALLPPGIGPMRGDLFILIPALTVILTSGLIRWIIVLFIKKGKLLNKDKRIQMITIIPLCIVLFIVGYFLVFGF